MIDIFETAIRADAEITGLDRTISDSSRERDDEKNYVSL